MYVPASFDIADRAELLELIAAHPFATLVTAAGGELFASHLPLLVDPRQGEHGTLFGHLARSNPHWKAFDGVTSALVIVQGPHGYVSPQWYTVSPAVPTWNYAAAHLEGRPRVIGEADRVARLLDELTTRFEPPEISRPGPASISSAQEAGAELRRRLLADVAAFELPIERWQLKYKLSQNRSPADQAAVIERLSTSSRDEDRTLAAFMREKLNTARPPSSSE